MRRLLASVALLPLLGCPSEAPPIEDSDPWVAETFPRCAATDPLRQPFFGDAHIHTKLSLDANLQGNRMTLDDAYAFAKGDQVGIQPYNENNEPMRTLQLERPLDWVAITDHAEFLGTVSVCQDPDSEAYQHEECVMFRERPENAFFGLNSLAGEVQSNTHYAALCGDDDQICLDRGMEIWSDIGEAAEAHYDRTDSCTFTSFVAYEWSGTPIGWNLHRNVIFRNEVVPEAPTSYLDESYESGLWTKLAENCLDQPNCDVLAIPHNSNLSGGLMFPSADSGEMDASVAAQRAELEPLVEIFQHKGDSECWPGSTAADELCGFEKIPYANMSHVTININSTPTPLDFVRDALGEGLAFQQQLGINPYKMGIIASTDTHLGTPGHTDSEDYAGHGGANITDREALPVALPDNATLNPGGLAVIWAEENSREALFRAMQRRETYGTSGPRIVLRFFGGWDYDEAMCDSTDFASIGYDNGVPMGGDLTAAGSTAPTFALSALADMGTSNRPGTPLQRLQIIKGWLDGEELKYEVFDVAGDPDNGAAVDPDTCETTGDGFTDLCTVWTDPDFDPALSAFYYARVVENPTCRWTTLQCNAAGISCPTDDEDWEACCDDRIEITQQERAWSSPIWVQPAEAR